jgi:predicted PurR-regulated permease PerM
LPNRASPQQRAVPKTMSGGQFERVMASATQLAMLVAGALALIVALSLGKVILAPISLAMVVGLMFGPLADVMERRGIAPALSAGVVVLVFLGVLVAGSTLFAVPLSEWIARVPVLWDKLRLQLIGLKQPLETLSALQDQLRSVMGSDSALTVKVQDGGPVQDVALMAPSVLADALLFLAGLYFFLAVRHNIRVSVLSLCFSRRARWRTAHIFRDVELKVSRFLISATLINLGVGVCTALAMWALGMPSPLLWGALAMAMNFIPYVGQAVMFVVLFAVGLASRSDLLGMILPVIVYAAINLTADQIVFPHLVGKALTLNPFVIFVSIAFWLWIWGPMGGFIAVPVLLVLQSIIMHIFPTTARLPGIVRHKLDSLAVNRPVEAAVVVDEPTKAKSTAPPESASAKTKRAPRKTATAASS